MRIIFLITSLLLTTIAFGQSPYLLLKKFDIPVYNFGSKPSSGEDFKPSLLNDGSGTTDIKLIKHKVFDGYELIYDELKELIKIRLYIKNVDKLYKRKKSIIDSVSLVLGKDSIVQEGDQEFHFFKSGKIRSTLFLTENDDYKYNTGLEITQDLPTKVKLTYDEFNKTTTIHPVGEYKRIEGINGEEYLISFVGVKESKALFFKVQSQSKTWKFIEKAIFLVDGEPTIIEFKTSRDIQNVGQTSFTFENAVCQLPEDLIKKIISGKNFKVRIQGKVTDDLTLNETRIQDLSAVYNALNN